MLDNSRPYNVTRLSENWWKVEDTVVTDIGKALELCEEKDTSRGFEWDFNTGWEARDAMEAMKIGETIHVSYPEEDDA
jgi:hypothetical protein